MGPAGPQRSGGTRSRLRLCTTTGLCMRPKQRKALSDKGFRIDHDTLRGAIPPPHHRLHQTWLRPMPSHVRALQRGDLDFVTIDITADAQARDFVMSLGYLQAPVVVAGSTHWGGFRPDRIAEISDGAA